LAAVLEELEAPAWVGFRQFELRVKKRNGRKGQWEEVGRGDDSDSGEAGKADH
jgi:hypothetical protein